MEVVQAFKWLERLAALLHTPNISKENIDTINHTMNYILNELHKPAVQMVDGK